MCLEGQILVKNHILSKKNGKEAIDPSLESYFYFAYGEIKKKIQILLQSAQILIFPHFWQNILRSP